MSKSELRQIVAETQQIQKATQMTLDTIQAWRSWNFNITQGRELGNQVIALSGLVAKLAAEVERLASD